MKVAFLILAHHQPEHLSRLVCSISADWNDIYIHIDNKVNLEPFIEYMDSTITPCFLKNEQRVDVRWGGFSIVEATLSLLSVAFQSDQLYDRFCLLSGADFPIKPLGQIKSVFATDVEFMRIDRHLSPEVDTSHTKYINFHHFVDSNSLADRELSGKIERQPLDGVDHYHGSAWWSLTRDCIDYIVDFLADNPDYTEYHRTTLCPDEIYFHSIVKESPYAENLSHDFTKQSDLEQFNLLNDHGCHYIDWNSPGERLPKVLMPGDACTLFHSESLFARKFDAMASSSLINKLELFLNQKSNTGNHDDSSSPQFINNNHKINDKVWVIGDGRSGTTWLADIINYESQYQLVFEPVHPQRSRELSELDDFTYRRLEQEDIKLERFARNIFSGKIFSAHSTVSAGNAMCPDKLIVKDIFTHLIAKWVLQRVSGIKLVLIMRHPFAVALSKQRHDGWYWMNEPENFLEQKCLSNDYLEPFENVIRGARSFFEKQVTIWSIIHYVMIQQLDENDFILLFYEDICRQPEKEISRLMQYLGNGKESEIKALLNIDKASKVSSAEALRLRGRENYSAWRVQITDDEYEAGQRILRSFMLDKLYDNEDEPVIDGVKNCRKKINSYRDEYHSDIILNKKPLLIVQLMSGLGNQMFQFAHGLSVSRELDMELKLDTSLLHTGEYRSHGNRRVFRLNEFGLGEKVISPLMMQNLGVAFDSQENSKNLTLMKAGISPTAHAVLRGYFQGEKFFSNVKEELRNIFTFQPPAKEKSVTLKRLIDSHKNTVAVHIRRGDYVNFSYFDVCKPDYFLRAKRYLNSILHDPQFIVFSEDITYCRKFMGEDAVYVDESISDVESLHLMALCSHQIISNSTFSWWSAWLARPSGGHVVAPERWFNNDQKNHEYLVVNNLIPEGWHQIEV